MKLVVLASLLMVVSPAFADEPTPVRDFLQKKLAG